MTTWHYCHRRPYPHSLHSCSSPCCCAHPAAHQGLAEGGEAGAPPGWPALQPDAGDPPTGLPAGAGLRSAQAGAGGSRAGACAKTPAPFPLAREPAGSCSGFSSPPRKRWAPGWARWSGRSGNLGPPWRRTSRSCRSCSPGWVRRPQGLVSPWHLPVRPSPGEASLSCPRVPPSPALGSVPSIILFSRSPCARQGWCPGAGSPCASGAPCQVEGGETEQSPPAPVGTRSAGPPSAVEGFRGERTLQKQAWGQGSRAGLESDRLRFKSGTFPSLAVSPWESHSTSLSLSPPDCEMDVTVGAIYLLLYFITF